MADDESRKLLTGGDEAGSGTHGAETALTPAHRKGAVLMMVGVFIVMGFIYSGRPSEREGSGRARTRTAVASTIALLSVPREGPAPQLRFATATVASEEITCSNIGRDILLEGGNAVDAVIATALCIGVINNFASGIGGGGFMTIDPGNGSEALFLDFREMAPAAAFRDMYKDNLQLAKEGGLASGVPGEMRGLEQAYRLYGGKVSWQALFAPSIALARNGFAVTPLLYDRLQSITQLCLTDYRWGKVYAPNNQTLAQVGDIIKREDLANTLEIIANNGSADPFYYGDLAATMIQDLQASNGTMTLADLANYEVVERLPLQTTYRGRTVLSGQPPSSGAVLLFLLNVLEGYPLEGQGGKTLTYHRIVEAMKFGFAERSYLGDPNFVNITDDVARMLNKTFAAEIRAMITDNSTHPPEYYGGKYEIQATPGTTHISAMDKDGLAVGMTSTVNLVWGSKLMTRTGIIMNNQMDDFSTPNTTNAFGLRASPNNYIQPGKRPLSSSTPTIVRNGASVELVAGASGGSRIITATLMTLLNALDFGMTMQGAVDAPRIHDQLYPSEIMVEYLFPKAIVDGLRAIGHNVTVMAQGASNSAVQAIRLGMDAYLYPASDPRKDGLASGY